MKVILCGACGKMGQKVMEATKDFPAEICCGIDFVEKKLPFPLYHSVREADAEADVFLDFSSPSDLKDKIEFTLSRKIPLLFAATGLSDSDNRMLSRAAETIPVMIAANLSPGICLLKKLLTLAAQTMTDCDAEIVEAHGKQKRDAPSGTALLLKKTIQAANPNLKIPIHSLRLSNLPGEHVVVFAGKEEILTVSHSAKDRKLFALGALQAASWLMRQPKGLYAADDVFFQ